MIHHIANGFLDGDTPVTTPDQVSEAGMGFRTVLALRTHASYRVLLEWA